MFVLLQFLVASSLLPALASPTSTAGADSETFIADGVFHGEIEGPAVDAAGNLYAVNFGGSGDESKGTIGKVTPQGQASLYLTLPQGSVGNGIRFDQQGRMYIADYTGHNIWRYDGKTLKVFSHQPKMHQPNDLAITHTGVLFASDPDWKNNSGQLWKIQPDGSSVLIEDKMGTTNGVAVSQDQRFLYVNESVQRRIWVYQLDAAYQPTQKKLLIEFPDFGLDGMRTDIAGNLYVARYGKGVIAKISPQGELLAEIALNGKFPTNVSFDPTEQWLYVTMQQRGAIERISLKAAKTSN
ncbi:gluconolactonase [Rheinheimera sp. SA_1]|uniref:SMP-30/gluconolactonase/LRE family protein n=1 Tax=Rheinheimera sp. SA_1 TaxID=1827365 RepID=UPI0007FC938D|nr:SMP-30/gluconolactonase/LRE family protein [Rheinheimera sp. SA_1]OBP17119.1 gluconolactonase [Rheinheimera sp. SA_1]